MARSGRTATDDPWNRTAYWANGILVGSTTLIGDWTYGDARRR